MEQISFYLSKFNNLGLNEETYKRELIRIISSQCNINLLESDIKIVRDKLIISKIGPEKTEIWLKKNMIEEELNNVVGKALNKKSNKKLI
jgi:hypothetical protein